jgi:hypothetical protein
VGISVYLTLALAGKSVLKALKHFSYLYNKVGCGLCQNSVWSVRGAAHKQTFSEEKNNFVDKKMVCSFVMQKKINARFYHYIFSMDRHTVFYTLILLRHHNK